MRSMYPWQAAALECGEAYNNLVRGRGQGQGQPGPPSGAGRQSCLLSSATPAPSMGAFNVSHFVLVSPQAPCLPLHAPQVYCAPTSGGKSLVAEVLMVRRLLASVRHIPQPRRSKPVSAARA